MRRVESLCTPSCCDPSIRGIVALLFPTRASSPPMTGSQPEAPDSPHHSYVWQLKVYGWKGARMNLMNFRGVLGENGSDPHYEVSTATMNWSFGSGIHRIAGKMLPRPPGTRRTWSSKRWGLVKWQTTGLTQWAGETHTSQALQIACAEAITGALGGRDPHVPSQTRKKIRMLSKYTHIKAFNKLLRTSMTSDWK